MNASPEPDEIGPHTPIIRGAAIIGIFLSLLGLAIGFVGWQNTWPRWAGTVLLVIALVTEVMALVIKPSLRFENEPRRFVPYGIRVPVLSGLGDTVLAWYDHRPSLLMLGLAFPLLSGLLLIGVSIGYFSY